MNPQAYFERIRKRKLFTGEMKGLKLGIFIKLNALSAKGYAKPKSMPDNKGASRGSGGMPAIISKTEYLVERAKLLNMVGDPDERKFLAHFSRFDVDILKSLDDGVLEIKNTRQVLNSALLDIARSIRGQGHGLQR